MQICSVEDSEKVYGTLQVVDESTEQAPCHVQYGVRHAVVGVTATVFVQPHAPPAHRCLEARTSCEVHAD